MRRAGEGTAMEQHCPRGRAARAAHRELRSLLVCCDWPGGRSYSRQAEEALPGRPIAPEGRVCP